MSTLEMFSMLVCGKKNDTNNLRQCERAFCLGRRLKAEIDFLFFLKYRGKRAICAVSFKAEEKDELGCKESFTSP